MKSENLDYQILMELQYRFPINETPYMDIALKYDLDLERLKNIVMKYRSRMAIKRIGFNINYKATGKVAALVAFKTPSGSINKLRDILIKDTNVTHNYMRTHPIYNVWFVIKRKTTEQLLEDVAKIARATGVEDYIVLLGKRTYKLSVKFDIINGTSWAEPAILPENVPTFSDLGLPREPFSELSKWIPIVERPFKDVAEKYGYREGELVDMLRELYRKRVIRNYGATLDGKSFGIDNDGMVVIEAGEDACRTIALEVPEATHVVYRVAIHGEWSYPVYFMAHADSREKIEAIARKASNRLGGARYMILYSTANLKPGIHSFE